MKGIKIRQTEPLADGAIKLFLRVNSKNKTSIITLPYVLQQEEWTDDVEQIVITRATSSLRREELESIRKQVNNDFSRMQRIVQRLNKKGEFRPGEATKAFREQSGTCFCSYMQQVINNPKEERKPSTLKNYESALHSFRHFLPSEDIRFEEITKELVTSYVTYLLAERKIKAASIKAYLSILQAVWNQARKEGVLENNCPSPFYRPDLRSEPGHKRAIEGCEIAKMVEVLPSIKEPSLKLSCALFLFSFYCRGMPFVDVAFLTRKNLSGRYLTYRRHKTGQLLSIKLIPPIKQLIDQYAAKEGPYLFPILKAGATWKDYQSARRVQNKRLKKVALLCGIETRALSTYVARHTWASIAKKKGVPEQVISDCLGHTSVRTTRRYINSFNNEYVDKANDVVLGNIRQKEHTFRWDKKKRQKK